MSKIANGNIVFSIARHKANGKFLSSRCIRTYSEIVPKCVSNMQFMQKQKKQTLGVNVLREASCLSLSQRSQPKDSDKVETGKLVLVDANTI